MSEEERPDYGIVLPPGYDPSKPYPYIIWLHPDDRDPILPTRAQLLVFAEAFRPFGRSGETL